MSAIKRTSLDPVSSSLNKMTAKDKISTSVLDEIMKDVVISDKASESVMMMKLGLFPVEKSPSIKKPLNTTDERLAQRKLEEQGSGNQRKGHTVRELYLDRMSNSQHTPNLTNEPWRNLLIQPISIPGLMHTGLTCAFVNREDQPLIRPDGGRTGQLSSVVRASVRKYQKDAVREDIKLTKANHKLSPLSKQQRKSRSQHSSAMNGVEALGREQPSPPDTGIDATDACRSGGDQALPGDETSSFVPPNPDVPKPVSVMMDHSMRAQARVRTAKDAVSQHSHNLVRDQHVNKKKGPHAKKRGKKNAYEQYEQTRRDRLAGTVEVRGNSRAIFESMLKTIYG